MLTEQQRATRRAHYEANRDEIRKKRREYRVAHIEEFRAKEKAYREANPEKYAAQKKASRKPDPEGAKRRNAKWYAAHAEEIRAKSAIKRTEKRDEILGYKRMSYRKHKAEILAKAKAYRDENPALYSLARHRRRSRKATTPEQQELIRVWYDSWRERKRVRCYWCNQSIATKKVHVDHITPLGRGGGHEVDNLCVSCPNCNLTKNATPAEEFNRRSKSPVLFVA